MTRLSYGLAAAESPGKHGERDWRVTYRENAPTHAELVFILGMVLLAEDRYSDAGQRGRRMLWQYIEPLLLASDPDCVISIADSCYQQTKVPLAHWRQPVRNGWCSDCLARGGPPVYPAVREGLCGFCWLERWKETE